MNGHRTAGDLEGRAPVRRPRPQREVLFRQGPGPDPRPPPKTSPPGAHRRRAARPSSGSEPTTGRRADVAPGVRSLRGEASPRPGGPRRRAARHACVDRAGGGGLRGRGCTLSGTELLALGGCRCSVRGGCDSRLGADDLGLLAVGWCSFRDLARRGGRPLPRDAGMGSDRHRRCCAPARRRVRAVRTRSAVGAGRRDLRAVPLHVRVR